ncbi:hypothetical protein ACA910_017119 [Epithemia clementina (nom. ined.)]
MVVRHPFHPRANKVTAACTIQLKPFNERGFCGHGLVFRMGNEYYVLTAAHVLAELFKCCTSNKLTFSAVSAPSFLHHVTVKEWFFPKEYVLSGLQDIGVAPIQSVSQPHELFQLAVAKNAGASLYGKSSMFKISGQVLSEGDEDGRVLIQAVSKLGASGTPLVTEDGNIFAVLHGADKHGRQRHNLGEASFYVYGDQVTGCSLHKVKCSEEVRELIYQCEDLNSEVATNPEKEYHPTTSSDYMDKAPMCLQRIMDHLVKVDATKKEIRNRATISLRTIMVEVAKLAFQNEVEPLHMPEHLDVLDLTNQSQLVS